MEYLKRFILSVLILGLMSTNAITYAATKGDVNGDGKINILDATMVLNYVKGKIPSIDKEAADVNNDGVVNILDATKILNVVKGIDTLDDYSSKIKDFRNKYPEGTKGDCFWLASRFTEIVYGQSNPRNGHRFTSATEIKAGDIIHITGHWFIVLSRNGNQLSTVDGNWTNGKASYSDNRYTIVNGRLTSQNMQKKNRSLIEGYHFR